MKINTNELRFARNKTGLTQKDVAKVLNIRVETYSLKERGLQQFTLEEFDKIINLFKSKKLKCKYENFILKQ